MIARYFAYGSNMNPERVRARGVGFVHAAGAWLEGFGLVFDKSSRNHAGAGHANILPDPDGRVEGVLYWLRSADELDKMDRFEATPVNYSREVIEVRASRLDLPGGESAGASGDWVGLPCWTYFANPAVRRSGLKPPRSYMNHLLAGGPYLSERYLRMLERWPCREDP